MTRSRTAWIAVLLLAGASTAVAQSQAEKDVTAAMEAWRQAILKSDGAALERLYHPDLSYGHSNGQIDTKAQNIEQALKMKTETAEFADMKVTVQGNVALAHGKVHLKQVIDGKPAEANLVVLHVWVKSAGGWQLIGRQATRRPQ
jgi:ketosteroid isomerase-like protein